MGCDKRDCCKAEKLPSEVIYHRTVNPDMQKFPVARNCCGQRMKTVGTTTYPYQFQQCEICGRQYVEDHRG